MGALSNAGFFMILFGYLGKINLGAHGMIISWLSWILEMMPFGYIVFLVWGKLSHEASKEPKPIYLLFLSARNLLFLALFFYPIATFVTFCCSSIGSTGLVVIAVGTSIADLLAKCGVGFYVYRIAIKQSGKEVTSGG